MRAHKLLFAILVLLACGLVAAGCGGDDDGGSDEPAAEQESTDGVDVPTSPEDVEGIESAEEAIEECKRQAEELPEGELRDLALDACEQGEQALEEGGGG